MSEKIAFCRGGGCTAKLGPGILERVLSRLMDTSTTACLQLKGRDLRLIRRK